MKKLMIAAAAAAMVGGVYAVDNPQVYDFTATLKTTSCSKNKSAKDVCGDTVYYRSQVTQKLYGKFWGCDCDVIGCPDTANYGIDDVNQDGYMFWTSTKVPGAFHGADWQWSILQRLGKKGENVEGAFDLVLTDCDGDTVATLAGAGYGTAKIDCADLDGNYIKSMSGNIVGTWDASSEVIATGCAYCGSTAQCEVFEFCDACGLSDNDMAVVFGSFTLKYNASNTKSVANGKTITDIAFKKNAAVLAEMACIADNDDDDDEVDEKAEAIKAYKAAKEAYDTAVATKTDLEKGATECTEGKKLAADADAANTTLKNAKDDEQTAWDALASNKSVQAAAGKLQTAKDELAAVKADEASTANDIAKAEEAVENAEKALNDAYGDVPGNKLADVKAAVVTYQNAYAARISAAEKSTAANKAVDDWNKTGYGEATEKAEEDVKTALTKMQIAQVNCQTKGGAADCE